MPARIHVSQGVLKGTVFEIQNHFTRIGSDLSSDICLPSPDIPGSVFILEYQETRREYHVFCRCEDTAYYNGRLVAKGTKFAWKPGRLLSIGNHVVLEFETEADPSPTPMESNWEKRIHDMALEHESQSRNLVQPMSSVKKNVSCQSGVDIATLIKVFVIVICLALIPTLYFVKSHMNKSDESTKTMPYAELENQLLLQCEDGRLPQIYLKRLMTARRLELRSSQQALDEYLRIRYLLLLDKTENHNIFSGDDDVAVLKQALWDYTIRQIQSLNTNLKNSPLSEI